MSQPKPLQGKVALITGSGRGVGKQIALELASRGASIIVNYVSSSGPAEEAVKEIEGLGVKAKAFKANISKPEEIESLFDAAMKEFGKLDIVVSNSGLEHFGKVTDVTPTEFDRIFSVNTRGQFFVAQQAYKHLSHGGRIILTSSISAQAKGVGNHAVYAGSKAAVEAFARCFAKDFGDKKITVNAIAPGGVKSDMYYESARKYMPGSESWSDEQVEAAVAQFSPLGRVGMPNDVAKVVAFLVSEDGEWINGQTITIGGGAAM
ncbi:hypothetical protein JAAARDRAFT_67356 [Jaapia argillacea MUCL 33604]|uniref:Ketoreductase domain-containing protein n=1 Tax=Jaapia argillacea MUCL 33604 TaxID=933084 RepID=A0A067Q1L7_9AGAM|nr:hypothetical protein JAAARDRAFT_67356 [Jaapia argillacea MUCL 33604]